MLINYGLPPITRIDKLVIEEADPLKGRAARYDEVFVLVYVIYGIVSATNMSNPDSNLQIGDYNVVFSEPQELNGEYIVNDKRYKLVAYNEYPSCCETIYKGVLRRIA